MRKEDWMELTRFNKPVSILVGLGYPAKIHSVKQAYEFLSETPTIAAKKAQSVTLKICKAALNGEIDAETARSAFVAFAERSAILAPEGQFMSPSPKHPATSAQGQSPSTSVDFVKGGA
jgi:hypothetical protein